MIRKQESSSILDRLWSSAKTCQFDALLFGKPLYQDQKIASLNFPRRRSHCRINRPKLQSEAPKSFAKADQIRLARSPEAVSNLQKPGSEYQATEQSVKQEQLRRVRQRAGTSQRHFFDLPDSEDCRRATSPTRFCVSPIKSCLS
jgi:hypothetical protein